MTLIKLLAAGLMTGAAGAAWAQEPLGPGATDMVAPPMIAVPVHGAEGGQAHRGGRMHGRMPQDAHHMGAMGSMPRKGFELEMASGASLEVSCGDEAIADCIAAFQPVIDRLAATPPAPPVEILPLPVPQQN